MEVQAADGSGNKRTIAFAAKSGASDMKADLFALMKSKELEILGYVENIEVFVPLFLKFFDSPQSFFAFS